MEGKTKNSYDENLHYLKKAKESAVQTAKEIEAMLKNGKNREEVIEFFKNKYYHGYIKEIYPVDAMELNTNITIVTNIFFIILLLPIHYFSYT